MKNHQARPIRMTDVPEAHYGINQCPKCQYRRGRGSHKSPSQGQQIQCPFKGGKQAQKYPNMTLKSPNFKNKGKAPDTMDTDMCYHCDSNDYWSRVCHAS
ncbi:hypothetical protein ACFX19_029171 [Malus domestica]